MARSPSESTKTDSDRLRRERLRAMRWSTIGFEYLIAVALFGWLGWKLDQALGLHGRFPAFLLLGLFLGIGFGTYRMALMVRSASRSGTQEPIPPAEDSNPPESSSP